MKFNTEYVYRVGLGAGQGMHWSDYFSFKSSPHIGAYHVAEGKPMLTFLALSDQGVKDSEPVISPKHVDVFASEDTASESETSAAKDEQDKSSIDPPQQVTDLITSMVDDQNQTINSIHHIGDLSYACGAGHIWDAFMDMIQPFAARVPMMVGVGNKEYDHTAGGKGKDPSGMETEFGFQPTWGTFGTASGGECGVPISKRFAAPENGNGVFW